MLLTPKMSNSLNNSVIKSTVCQSQCRRPPPTIPLPCSMYHLQTKYLVPHRTSYESTWIKSWMCWFHRRTRRKNCIIWSFEGNWVSVGLRHWQNTLYWIAGSSVGCWKANSTGWWRLLTSKYYSGLDQHWHTCKGSIQAHYCQGCRSIKERVQEEPEALQ